jgi:hypothetical protein
MYTLIFDIENKLAFPILQMLIFIAFLVIFLLYKNRFNAIIKDKYKKYFLYFVFIFLTTISLVIFLEDLKIYNYVNKIIKSNTYHIAEGVVYDVKKAPFSGHKKEYFKIKDKIFSYSDYDISIFYHKTISHGGAIKNGAKVKLAYITFKDTKCLPFIKYLGYKCPEYIENKILKVWIAP